MGRLLFVVEDVFEIRSRGIVAVPGITPLPGEKWKVGDAIELRRPNESTLCSEIAGIEMVACTPPLRSFAILLKGVTKAQVPIGTEVWSVDSAAEHI